MNQEEDPEEVPRLLDARGYKCVFKSRSLPNTFRYEAPSISQDVAGYVSLERKPRQRAYSVAFGATCKAAEHLLESADASLRASPLIPAHSLATPFVAWFSAGRLLRCPILNIPDRTGSKSLPQLLDELVTMVLQPYVEGPTSCLEVLTILRYNELPFEWAATFPVRRALLLAATARVLGMGRQEVTDELLAYRSTLRGDLQHEEVWGGIVTFIVLVLWGSKRLGH
jgi:hypothetical protein